MGRRGNGEGTIRRRTDGRWEARLLLADGRYKSLYGKTRAEAATKLAAAIRDRDAGMPTARSERLTLAVFLTDWLVRIEHTVRPRTFRRYSELLRGAIESLGRVPLSKLTPEHIERFYAEQLSTGSKSGKGLSSTTVNHLHAVLHHALRDAVRKGLVVRNVCDLVDAPRMRRPQIKALSPDQARHLLEAIKGDRLEALYVLALTTGLRQGELLALHWADVDLDKASLQVRGTLQRFNGRFVIAEPKTAQSRRSVALTSLAVDALHAHRTRQLEERLAMGSDWQSHDLVFCRQDGNPIDGTGLLRHHFHPLLARAGLPRMRFHDLRHATASLLVELGVPHKVVQDILGHTSIRVTLDLYAHVRPEFQREAMLQLDRALRSN